jgi:hypothetical protein
VPAYITLTSVEDKELLMRAMLTTVAANITLDGQGSYRPSNRRVLAAADIGDRMAVAGPILATHDAVENHDARVWVVRSVGDHLRLLLEKLKPGVTKPASSGQEEEKSGERGDERDGDRQEEEDEDDGLPPKHQDGDDGGDDDDGDDDGNGAGSHSTTLAGGEQRRQVSEALPHAGVSMHASSPGVG